MVATLPLTSCPMLFLQLTGGEEWCIRRIAFLGLGRFGAVSQRLPGFEGPQRRLLNSDLLLRRLLDQTRAECSSAVCSTVFREPPIPAR